MTLQFGVSGILNLAYGDVMIVGAYAGYAVNSAGANIGWSLATGAVVGAALSVLLNQVIFRKYLHRGTGLFGMVIVTLAISIILQNTLLAVLGPNSYVYQVPGGSVIHIGPTTFTILQLAIIGLAVLLMLLIHIGLTHTRLGTAMRATSSDPVLAGACGVRTGQVINTAWLISGMLCGMAGVILAINTIAFNFTTGSTFLIVIVAAVILGGVGQVYGAMAAAVAVGVAASVAAAYLSPSYEYIVAFGMLVIVILIRPSGLFGSPRVDAGAG